MIRNSSILRFWLHPFGARQSGTLTVGRQWAAASCCDISHPGGSGRAGHDVISGGIPICILPTFIRALWPGVDRFFLFIPASRWTHRSELLSSESPAMS